MVRLLILFSVLLLAVPWAKVCENRLFSIENKQVVLVDSSFVFDFSLVENFEVKTLKDSLNIFPKDSLGEARDTIKVVSQDSLKESISCEWILEQDNRGPQWGEENLLQNPSTDTLKENTLQWKTIGVNDLSGLSHWLVKTNHQDQWEKVTSPILTIDSLPYGSSTFDLKIVDKKGNESAILSKKIFRKEPLLPAPKVSWLGKQLGVGTHFLQMTFSFIPLKGSRLILGKDTLTVSDSLWTKEWKVAKESPSLLEDPTLLLHTPAGNVQTLKLPPLLYDLVPPSTKENTLTFNSLNTQTLGTRTPLVQITGKNSLDFASHQILYQNDTLQLAPEGQVLNFTNGIHIIHWRAQDLNGNVSLWRKDTLEVNDLPIEVTKISPPQCTGEKCTLRATLSAAPQEIQVKGNGQNVELVFMDSTNIELLLPLDSLEVNPKIQLEFSPLRSKFGVENQSSHTLETTEKMFWSWTQTHPRLAEKIKALSFLLTENPYHIPALQMRANLLKGTSSEDFLTLTTFLPERDSLIWQAYHANQNSGKTQIQSALLERSLLLRSGKLPQNTRSLQTWIDFPEKPLQATFKEPASGSELVLNWNRRAREFSAQGLYLEAQKELQQALYFDSSAVLYYNLGTVFLQGNNPKEALSFLETAHQKNPELFQNLAIAYAALGQSKKALALLEKDDSPQGHWNQNILRTQISGIPRLDALTKERAQISNLSKLYTIQFALQWRQEENASRLLEEIPLNELTQAEQAIFQFLQIEILRKKGLILQALNKGRSLLLKAPWNALLYQNLAGVFMEQGHLEMSESLLNMSLLLKNNNPEALQQLAKIHMATGREESAIGYQAQAKRISREKEFDKMKFAVLPFQALGVDSSKLWISTALAQGVSNHMKKRTNGELIERQKLQSLTAFSDQEQLFQQSKLKGAQQLILGSFQIQGEQLKIQARLVRTEDGTILETQEVITPLDSMGNAEEKIVFGLLGLDYASRSKKTTSISLEARKKLDQAQKLIDQGKRKEASKLTSEAVEADPSVLALADELTLVDEKDVQGKSLAILPFQNLNPDTKLDWIGHGIQEALTTDLKQIGGLYTIERSQVTKIMQELALGSSGMVEPSQAPEVGKLLSAGVLVMGSVQKIGNQLRINARLVESQSGEIRLSTQVEGEEEELFDMQRALGIKILEALKIHSDSYQQRKRMARDPLALKTLEDQLRLEQPVFNQEPEKDDQKSSSNAGLLLIGASTISTLVSGWLYYEYLYDVDLYNTAENRTDALYYGERAERTAELSFKMNMFTLGSWAITGGYYFWRVLK